MTLRAQLERAYSAWLATKSHRWAAEVSRLNRLIMKRTRPVTAALEAGERKKGLLFPKTEKELYERRGAAT
jgi:hypothetical protein